MGHYLINFIAYTLAMVGIIFLCLLVYKKCFLEAGQNQNFDFLKVENCINIAPRKSVYVLKAGNERFLIASDVDRTSFLAKLDDKASVEAAVSSALKPETKRNIEKPVLEGVSISTDFYSDELKIESNITKLPVMKELVKKLNSQRG